MPSWASSSVSIARSLPSALKSGPSLNATGNDVAIESITIVHEGLKRIK